MEVRIGSVRLSRPPRRQLGFDNPRRIATLEIPGAPPVFQDMGEGETVIEWDGVLVGKDAYQQAIRLEIIKDSGQVVDLYIESAPELCKKVRIRRFPWRLVRKDYIEYSIELLAIIPPPAVTNNAQGAAQSTMVTAKSTTSYTVANKTTSTQTKHTVRSGDTLWTLAQKYLGDGSRWREIANANQVMDPRKLQVGQNLVIPI